MTVKKTSSPKYMDVHESIRGRIEQGELAVGALLPTEEQLCEHYEVSRNTIREALGLLERQGYIERRRRAGRRVLPRPVSGVLRQATTSRADFLSFIAGTYVDFGEPKLIQADLQLARQLGCDELRRWHLLEGIRYEVETNRPIGVMKLYIDADRADVPADIDFQRRPVVEWLENKYGIKPGRVSQDISAVNLSEAEAEALREHSGNASLRIIRRYFDRAHKIFQISVTTYRSIDFGYNVQLDLDAN